MNQAELKQEYGLTDDEAALVAANTSDRWEACARLISSLKRDCATSGIGIYIRYVTATRGACVILVAPTEECSIPYFEHRLQENFIPLVCKVWGHVPGFFGLALEYGIPSWGEASDIEEFDVFAARDAWRVASNDIAKLPIALGVDMLGRDIVLDLASMSHLVVMGGDTQAQDCVVGGMLKSLQTSHGGRNAVIHLLEYSGLSLELSVKSIGGPVRPQLEPSGPEMAAGCKKAMEVFAKVREEIEFRDRVFDATECGTIQEYNERSKRPLPHVVVVVADPPDRCNERGCVKDAFREFNSSLGDLLYQNTQKYGVHVILVTFALLEPHEDLAMIVQGIVGGRQRGLRVGYILHCCNEECLSYQIFGGPELAKAETHHHMLYRTPDNEVYKIHKLGKNHF